MLKMSHTVPVYTPGLVDGPMQGELKQKSEQYDYAIYFLLDTVQLPSNNAGALRLSAAALPVVPDS